MKLTACFILLLFSILLGCYPSKLSPENLSEFVTDEDNGLVKNACIGNISLQVMYQPTDIWVYRELVNKQANTVSVDKIRSKYNPYLYFLLSISNDGREALHQLADADYSNLVQTTSFRMNEYVTLSTSAGDTLEVADFMLNRTYGMNTSTDILFVFDRSKLHGQDWLQFNLNEFGLAIGNQELRFEMSALENIPEVTFNN
jgi:hypothetical protein